MLLTKKESSELLLRIEKILSSKGEHHHKLKDFRNILEKLFITLCKENVDNKKLTTNDRIKYIFKNFPEHRVVRNEADGLRTQLNEIVHEDDINVTEEDVLRCSKDLKTLISNFEIKDKNHRKIDTDFDHNDVTPLSLLYKDPISGEYISIFEAESPIPISKTIIIKFVLQNQSSFHLSVFLGEINWGDRNRLLARIHFDNIPGENSITIKYKFTFQIDENGILHVAPTDNETGKIPKIKIQRFGGLSKKDIEELKKQCERK